MRPSRVAHVAELRREDDRIPSIPEGPSDENLVGMRPIHVGGIEKRDAEIESALDRPDRFLIIASRIELGHAHASEANG
jgi:hypothetical protein